MKEKPIVYLTATLVAIAWVAGAAYYARSARQQQQSRAGAADAAEAERPLAKVKICEVFHQPLIDTLTLPGTVEAYEEVEVAARSEGTIEWIGPEEGDRVEAGTPLLGVDLELASTRVAEASTAYELAELRYKRVKELYEQSVAAVDQMDEAEAGIKRAKAALDAAETSLSHGTIIAPIGGTVDRLPVDVGEYVAVGQPVLRLVDIDRVKVRLDLPERDVLYLGTGSRVEIRPFHDPQRAIPGTIEFVAMSAERDTRTYPVKILVENPEHSLRPGMIVRVSVVRRQVEQAVAIPFFTMVDRESGKAVFVVEQGVARERPVEFGSFQGGLIEIIRGLDPGDKLIVVGQRNLVNGQAVEVVADVTDIARNLLKSGQDLSGLSIETLF